MPDRVIVDRGGYGVPSNIAEKRYKVIPDIIFKRNDGWTLGAPKEFEDVAYRMWRDEWTHFVRRPNSEWKGIGEY